MFLNRFKKEYTLQGAVQFHEGKPIIAGSSIKWFDEVKVKALTYNKAVDIALQMFDFKYPEYKGFFEIW